MILLAAASVFAFILTSEGITVAIADAVLGVSSKKAVILLMMNIILLIGGMFMDGASLTTILGPLFLPIAQSAGIDIVHLGIVMVVNAAIRYVYTSFWPEPVRCSKYHQAADVKGCQGSNAIYPYVPDRSADHYICA